MSENAAPSKKIISIDVGIARLAFCLFVKPAGSTEYHIGKWSIVNLTKTSEESNNCCTAGCKNAAVLEKNGQKYFKKHCKKMPGLLPSADLKPAKINKLKLADLFALADKYAIPYKKDASPSLKKADITAIITQYIKTNCFQPIEKTNASELDLNTIGRNIKENFNTIFSEDMESISDVIIENQLSPMAIRMKTIQGMISQYFIMKNENIQIRFVNATNKLKSSTFEKSTFGKSTFGKSGAKTEQNSAQNIVVSANEVEQNVVVTVNPEAQDFAPLLEKADYKDRKDLSIETCKHIINTEAKYKNTQWISFINEKRKKDGIADLADCFLQGLWYLSTSTFPKSTF
jgi:hypothetical protein